MLLLEAAGFQVGPFTRSYSDPKYYVIGTVVPGSVHGFAGVPPGINVFFSYEMLVEMLTQIIDHDRSE